MTVATSGVAATAGPVGGIALGGEPFASVVGRRGFDDGARGRAVRRGAGRRAVAAQTTQDLGDDIAD